MATSMGAKMKLIISSLLVALCFSQACMQEGFLEPFPPRKGELLVDGRYLHAFVSALKELRSMKRLSSEQKKVENYAVYFSENKEVIWVRFAANYKKSDPIPTSHVSRWGVDQTFEISKRSGKLLRIIVEG
jgi:hypothetical protein